jgi:Holliday junction DNA helicase RuvA
MIGYLRGKAFDGVDGSLLIEVRDVGYQVLVTESTHLWALAQQNVSLWIHTMVKENVLDLYGFETQNELYFFKKLIEVSGIGPKSALGIIGLASTDTLYQAILSDNIAFLTSVPGIGKKTAERMCIELRDKLKDYRGNTEIHDNPADSDVIDALLALGYTQAQSHSALGQIDKEVTELNERIKEALNIINKSS